MKPETNDNTAPDTAPTDVDETAQDNASDTFDAQGEAQDDDGDAFMAGVDKVKANPSDDPDYVPGLKDLEAKEPARDAADVAAEAAAKAGDKAGDVPADDAKAKIEQEIADEITSHRLKPGSSAAVRFHEMALSLKTSAPTYEALKSAGFETPEAVQDLVAAAKRGIEWEDAVLSSKCTPEQFGVMMQTATAINQGTVETKSQALDRLIPVMKALAKDCGRSIEGLVDPLEDYPDLQAMVDNMEITPEVAQELMRSRISERQHTQHDQTVNAQTSQQQEYDTGMRQAAELDAKLSQSDPHYAAKLPLLMPTLAIIRERVPPSQWAEQIMRAYAQIPNPAPVAQAAKPRIGHMPGRTGSVPSATVRREPTSDVDAFMMGVESVSR